MSTKPSTRQPRAHQRRSSIRPPSRSRATQECAWRHRRVRKHTCGVKMTQGPFHGTVPASLRVGVCPLLSRTLGPQHSHNAAGTCTSTSGPSIPTMPLVRAPVPRVLEWYCHFDTSRKRACLRRDRSNALNKAEGPGNSRHDIRYCRLCRARVKLATHVALSQRSE